MPEETKFRGVPVLMGGREYSVPSLSVRQYRDNEELLTAPVPDATGVSALETFTRYIPLIGLALRRNYPEMTDDSLWDLLDLGNFREVVLAIQGASGLKPVKPGEAQPVA